MYSAWESTATLRLLGGARGARALIGEEKGGGILYRHAHSLLLLLLLLRQEIGMLSTSHHLSKISYEVVGNFLVVTDFVEFPVSSGKI